MKKMTLQEFFNPKEHIAINPETKENENNSVYASFVIDNTDFASEKFLIRYFTYLADMGCFVLTIKKTPTQTDGVYCLSAYVANTRTNIYETLRSPSFKGNERFKNLVVDKEYTTKELGF